jgi:hypothetical protein
MLLSALCAGASDASPRTRRRALARCLRWLREHAHHAELEHFVLLVEAESARLGPMPHIAVLLYAQGAQRALDRGFLHHAAIAHERRAVLLLALDRTRESEAARARAVRCYREWGATAKVRELARMPLPARTAARRRARRRRRLRRAQVEAEAKASSGPR